MASTSTCTSSVSGLERPSEDWRALQLNLQVYDTGLTSVSNLSPRHLPLPEQGNAMLLPFTPHLNRWAAPGVSSTKCGVIGFN